MRDEEAVNMVVLGVACVFLLIALVIAILFLLTLQKCLSRVQPRNRDMEPGMVWLNLVPCLNLVWIFMTVSKIGSSLQKEFRSRGWRTEGEGFGVGIGMAYAGLSIASNIPYVGLLFAIPALICYVIYWVQIANYSARIAKPADSSDRYGDEEDDYDRDRPSRRRRDDDEDRGEPDDRIQRRDW